MGNDLHNLSNKRLIWRDFGVPVLYKFLYDNGYEGVQLKVHIIAAGKRWK